MNPKSPPTSLITHSLISIALILVIASLSLSLSMADDLKTTLQDQHKSEEEVVKVVVEGEEAADHIVYALPPEGEEQEAYNIRTLAAVVGSEEAAKKVLMYHYKHAASGFSAMLTPKQVEELSKQPGVLQIVRSVTYQLAGPGISAGVNLDFGLNKKDDNPTKM